MANQLVCEKCNEIISEGDERNLDDYILCISCRENSFICSACEELADNNNMHSYRDGYVCEDCYSAVTKICDCCGSSYDPDDADAWNGMCSDCANEHFLCDNCGEIYCNDNYGGNGLCYECSEPNRGPIKDYHSGPKCSIRFCPDHSESLYFGVELETDDYNDRVGAAEDLEAICNGDKLFWLEVDGSLHNGIEIISQPCTLDYHRDHFPWKQITKIVQEHGGKAERTAHAAMHVHFSTAYFGKHPEICQLRLIYLFEHFYKELTTLGKTTDYLAGRSAKKYDTNLFDCRPQIKIEQIKSKRVRLQAVNILNFNTTEIRIFGSTLLTSTILARLELVDFLVRLAHKTSTKNLLKITWVDLTNQINTKKYRYLPQYIKKIEGRADK